MTMQTINIPIEKLRPFKDHPFKVADDGEMLQLMRSIRENGLLTPISVRPIDNDECEVISGHRRLHACKKAGYRTVPALVFEMDRDAATIAMVDNNLHREKILPSEKAFAYKLKMDAMKHQGKRTDLTSSHVGARYRTDEAIAQHTSDSARQIQRYIRLTNLIPEILQMVDDGKIALTPAVEISYLTPDEQEDLLTTMESEDCTPSLSQANQMKRLSQAEQLNLDTILEIMLQIKPNQKEKISFLTEDISKYFPSSYTPARMQETIMKLLADYQRKRQHSREER